MGCARDLQRLKDAYADAPEFFDIEQSEFSAAVDKVDELIAQCESNICDLDTMNGVWRKTLAKPEEMLRQMPDF